jgi:hypothetical protein
LFVSVIERVDFKEKTTHENLDLQQGQDADGKVDSSSMVQVDSKDTGRRSEPFEIIG